MDNIPFVGGISYRELGGKIEVLLQDGKFLLPEYSRQGILTRFPGGMWEPEDGDLTKPITLVKTLRREYSEETFLLLRSGFEPEKVYDWIAKKARKVFFLFPYDALEGSLRTEEIKYEEETELFPPYWASVSDIMSGRVNLYRTHMPAFKEAIPRIQKQLLAKVS
ncbi:MAG: hypothetical protein WAX85_03285 [Minisyncoccia bacterium]